MLGSQACRKMWNDSALGLLQVEFLNEPVIQMEFKQCDFKKCERERGDGEVIGGYDMVLPCVICV